MRSSVIPPHKTYFSSYTSCFTHRLYIVYAFNKFYVFYIFHTILQPFPFRFATDFLFSFPNPVLPQKFYASVLCLESRKHSFSFVLSFFFSSFSLFAIQSAVSFDESEMLRLWLPPTPVLMLYFPFTSTYRVILTVFYIVVCDYITQIY